VYIPEQLGMSDWPLAILVWRRKKKKKSKLNGLQLCCNA